MKKFLIYLLMIFSCSVSFANISSINAKGSSLIISVEKANSREINTFYDEDSRLLFIEMKKTKAGKNIINKKISSNYVTEFKVEDYKGSVGIFMKLNNGINYVMEKKSKSINIQFINGKNKKGIIIIDPGHGGKDPGASSGGSHEKTIVLAVSKYLQKELSKDFEVIMTRSTDTFISLSKRPQIGNDKKAKIFVSIHANASVNKKANGSEVFYFSKKSSPYAERIAAFENSFGDKYGEKSSNIAQIAGELAYKKNQENSTILAKKTVDKISSSMGMKNGGIHGANFAVLRGFNGPGMLVELGFITNTDDRNKLIKQRNQKIMAEKIAEAIREYVE